MWAADGGGGAAEKEREISRGKERASLKTVRFPPGKARKQNKKKKQCLLLAPGAAGGERYDRESER